MFNFEKKHIKNEVVPIFRWRSIKYEDVYECKTVWRGMIWQNKIFVESIRFHIFQIEFCKKRSEKGTKILNFNNFFPTFIDKNSMPIEIGTQCENQYCANCIFITFSLFSC